MLRPIVFVLLLFSSALRAQESEFILRSSGAFPEFIDASQLTIERYMHSAVDPLDMHQKTELHRQHVLNSGRVVFGHSASMYLQKLFKEIYPQSEVGVYIVRSYVPVTFSNESNIFITTGLIAQLNSRNQMAFFLARENELRMQGLNIPIYPKKGTASIDEKILTLGTYSTAANLEADQKAIAHLKFVGFSLNDLANVMDVLLYKEMPYAQKELPADYFNNALFYVPEEFFDVYGEKGAVALDNTSVFKQYEASLLERKNNIRSSVPESTAQAADSGFEHCRLSCRFETIRQFIITRQYEKAIYLIFAEEGNEIPAHELDRLKAHAWLGYLQRSINSSVHGVDLRLQEVHSPSTRFFLALRKLNANGIAAFATRTIRDLKLKYQNDEYELIWEELVRCMHDGKYISPEKFSSKKFSDAQAEALLIQAQADSMSSKYDQIELTRNEAANFDPREFYFYGLSDLISGQILQKDYARYIAADSLTKSQPANISLLTYLRRYKSNRQIKPEASVRSLIELNASLDEVSALTGDTLVPMDIPQDPYSMEIIADCYAQFFQFQYNSGVLCLRMNEFDHLNVNTETLGVLYAESMYRFKYQPIHSVWLLGVTIPWVVSDMTMRSMHASTAFFLIDMKSGKVIYNAAHQYTDRNNALILKNRLFHYLKEK
jgi:hypothetical protein